jgi:serine O-acetyltransferase
VNDASTLHRLRAAMERWRRGLLGVRGDKDTSWYWAAIRNAHPPFANAVLADAQVAAGRRDERSEFRNKADAVIQVIRLAIVTDSFFGQICYRAKARCQTHRIPLLPRILHLMAVRNGGICIGDPVVMHPGVHIPHGHVVVNGGVEIGAGVVLAPFTTLGRVSNAAGGPRIGPFASIGTGAKVLGPVKIGARAKVGANAVVLSDVPAGATAVGAPARIVGSDEAAPPSS